MPVKFDTAMAAVMQKVLTMGSLADQMVQNVVATLVNRNLETLQSIYNDEKKMDLLQRDVDDAAMEMISVYTPVAADLRLILMMTRINGELERIGDQAVNICHIVEDLLTRDPLKPLEDLPRMANQSLDMMRKALKAFADRSIEGAAEVLRLDDNVDRLHDQLTGELMAYMDRDPTCIRRALGLLLITRGIERVADHAVNIAEDTVYVINGRDIRHLHPGDKGYPVPA